MFYNKIIFRRCFCYGKRYWYKNIKNIPKYFGSIHHLVKHGFDECAYWDTYSWFIDVMKEVFGTYKKHHGGAPILIENYPYNCANDEKSKTLREFNDKMWEDVIDRMIELLEWMDESSCVYENSEYELDYKHQMEKMEQSKDEFFELFSKHFYRLWD